MADTLDQELRFFFKSEAQGSAALNVVRLEGSEAISQLFRFKLILTSHSAEIDFKAMLSNSATLIIRSADGSKAFPYHGELAEFEQLEKVNEFVFYRAVLVPRVHRLSLNKINEVYLNEHTIPEVIEEVLKTGIAHDDFDKDLKDKSVYRKRSFICQHQESNLDFISRWMESEGMYYFFEHGDADSGTDKLKILDYMEGHSKQSISLKYCQTEDIQTKFQDQNVTGFICKQKPLPKTVIVQDFNYRHAHLENLKATETVSESGHGEVMFYGDNLRTNEEAKALAKVRAQELKCREQIFSGDSTAVGIRSGYFLELTDHYRKSFNTKYLVTEVQHFGSQAGVLLGGAKTPYTMDGAVTNYRASFIAILADTQFRPERVTPKPLIAGTMNAIVDSDGSGDYAEVDEYGQYKVQLLYDLSEKHENKGSARIRMASPYAGKRNGMHFPLLKGTEVLLSFLGGDPDQPVIMAAVPNSENLSVVNSENLYNSGMSTPSGNQFTFSDKPGDRGYRIHIPGVMTMGAIGVDSGRGDSSSANQKSAENTPTANTSSSYKLGDPPPPSTPPAPAPAPAPKAALGYSYSEGYFISLTKGGSSKVTLSMDAAGSASMSNKLTAGISNETKASLDTSFAFGSKISYAASGDYKLSVPVAKDYARGNVHELLEGSNTEYVKNFKRLAAGAFAPTDPIKLASSILEKSLTGLVFVAGAINSGLLITSMVKVASLSQKFGTATNTENHAMVTGLGTGVSSTFSTEDYVRIAEVSSLILSAASFVYLSFYKFEQPESPPTAMHLTEDQFIGAASSSMGSSSVVLDKGRVRIRSSSRGLEVPYDNGKAIARFHNLGTISEIDLDSSRATFKVPNVAFLREGVSDFDFKILENLTIKESVRAKNVRLGLVASAINFDPNTASIDSQNINLNALNEISLTAGAHAVKISNESLIITGNNVEIAGLKMNLLGGAIESLSGAITKIGDISALGTGSPSAYTASAATNSAVIVEATAEGAKVVALAAVNDAEIVAIDALQNEIDELKNLVIDAQNSVDKVLGRFGPDKPRN